MNYNLIIFYDLKITYLSNFSLFASSRQRKQLRNMTSAFSWITADETAEQALIRIFKERPFLILPPPFHRLPLRAGNVVEIVGPSPSAKTLILIQVKTSAK